MLCFSHALFANALDVLVDGRNETALHLLGSYEGRLGIVLLNLLVNLEGFVVLLLALEQEASLDEVLRASGGVVGFASSLLKGVNGLVELTIGSVAVGEGSDKLRRNALVALGRENLPAS